MFRFASARPLQVPRGHGFLVPEGVVRLYKARDLDGVDGREAAVRLHQDLHVGADGLAHGPHPVRRGLLGPPVDDRAPGAGEGVELEGREPHPDDLGRVFRELVDGPASAPAVGVDLDFVPAGAAQQVVDGLPGGLARDVPEGVLQGADRAVEVHGPALAREVGVGHEGEVLDVERAAPDQVAAQLLDVGLNGAVPVVLRVGLPPAVQALVGLDPDEQPVLGQAGVDEEGLDCGDFHGNDSEDGW